jgi:FixJ family two-component response regulator
MATQTTPPEVLIVEDDESLRGALERLLALAGFSTLAYGSAEELLTGRSAEDAACIVCDFRLPAMSGLDLLAALRARSSRAPLILITAHDQPGLAREATRRGAAGYLVKPFPGTALLAAVRAAIAAEATP